MLELQEDINIKDLSFPNRTRKERLYFSRDRDLSEKDWEKAVAHLKYNKRILAIADVTVEWRKYAELAADLKLLFPERTNSLQVDEKTWQYLERYYQSISQNRDPDHYQWQFLPGIGANLRILFPDRIDHLLIGDEYLKYWSKLDNNTLEKYPHNFLSLSARSKITFGGDVPWMEVKDSIKDQLLEKYSSQKEATDKIAYAADMKILFPDRWSEIDIAHQTWQEALSSLSISRRNEHWGVLMHNARNLLITQADQIKVSKNGLEISNPSQPEPILSSSLPERRKF